MNAIGYIRISDKDQSNFSIDGQQRYISDYCTRHGHQLLETFIDDGQSASTFERSDWRKLEQFIRLHHRQVNYLIVVKYDRFSRNAAEGLLMIDELEKKYGIIIVSVFEQMFIDFDSPYYFKQRADMLVNAEFEWHVIRDRTKFGIHQANMSGRFINVAPTGYKNARDEKNKPILIIDPEKARQIRRIFEMFMAGHPMAEIGKAARAGGLRINSRTAIPYILRNPVYAGMVPVKPYRKEPARIVDGIHEAIISKDLFYQVQRKLNAPDMVRTRISDEVPLRAVVAHSCGRPLTAGKSKGRRQHYWYYKCNACRQTSYSANTMHAKFDALLSGLSFSSNHIQYLVSEAERQMKDHLQERTAKLAKLRRDHAKASEALQSLEEKYIANQVHADTYERMYRKYTGEIAEYNARIRALQGNEKKKWEDFHTGIMRLSNIQWLWQQATTIQKHEFLRLVFNSGLSYDGTLYRTPYLLPLFSHNELNLKEKGLLLVEKAGPKTIENHECAPVTTPVEHFSAFFSLISNIKIA